MVTVQQTRKGLYTETVMFFIAVLIAFSALLMSAEKQIDLENLAKGEQNSSRVEVYNGRPYTAETVDKIKSVIDDRRININPHGCRNSLQNILWLGNSQLHYINQYSEDDHLSPYWLRMASNSPECIDLMGFSLGNASFQEFLILSRYVQFKLPLNMLIMELVFDDLREDGLRSDFANILTPDFTEAILNQSASTENIIRRFFANRKIPGDDNSKSVLSGTIQEPVEHWLNHRLGSVWSLWTSRSQIEGKVLYGIYRLRNAVFGIKPTTVRNMIKARYDLNMAALNDILADCKRNGTPALLYIAPIRQDKPIPYNSAEYAAWKQEVDTLARQYGVRLINLETLVPGELWGSCVGEQIDFMHFRGPGHRLVADALLPHVKDMLAEKDI